MKFIGPLMKIFGLEVRRTKSTLSAVPVRPGSSFWSVIRESVAGAWQKGVEIESTENLLAFGAVYGCVTLIAGDISKLRPRLMRQDANGIWQEVREQSPFWGVLRKPNNYQTRIQFLSAWMTCKLLNGNTYVLKERDDRGIVRRLHILDPRRVTALVAQDGQVFYQVQIDRLAEVVDTVTVPASEIIHDRMFCPFHPLVGVSPIYACGLSATQGRKIQNNSSVFFENMSRPGGQLTSPHVIDDVTANRLKREFEDKFGGTNVGRLFVAGDGLKYEAMTIPAAESQMIEQQRWTVEDVARAFRVPLYKISGTANPTYNNVGALNQDYYSQTLQEHIEAIEVLLDEGLSLPTELGTDLDLRGLLRMDPVARADANSKNVGSGILAPNEARADEDKPPVAGGETPYLQQQNYSLAALAKRDKQADPFGAAKPPPAAPAPPQLPPPAKELDDEVITARAVEEACAALDMIMRGLDVEVA